MLRDDLGQQWIRKQKKRYTRKKNVGVTEKEISNDIIKYEQFLEKN